jgi:hypothetical protein
MASAAAFVPQAELVPGDGVAGVNFGTSVSVDGTTAVVGAPSKNAAYVYIQTGSSWALQQELTAFDSSGNFGGSVSLSGDTVVVGAFRGAQDGGIEGAAYVYARSGTTWSLQQKLVDGAADDWFGTSVSISADTVVVGAAHHGAQGAAYVYVRSGTTWAQQQELTASDGTGGDQFGVSVSASGDLAAIGTFTTTPHAYIFARSGSSWVQQQKLAPSDGAPNDAFGFSVSISGGTVVVGGNPNAATPGAAYVFVQSGTSWAPQQKLTPSDGANGDGFGGAVSLSGNQLIVGAAEKNAQGGAAYVFVGSGTSWTQQSELVASDGTASGDFFGGAVAVGGTTAIVGANGKASARGAAYVFAPPSCSVPAPSNGTLGSCASVLFSGRSCQFACNSGYAVVGAATSCSNGVLTAQACGALPPPVAIQGPALPAIAGTVVTLSAQCTVSAPSAPALQPWLVVALAVAFSAIGSFFVRRAGSLAFAVLIAVSGLVQPTEVSAQVNACAGVAWTVSLGSQHFTGTGSTFSFTPATVGTYHATATLNGYTASTDFAVTKSASAAMAACQSFISAGGGGFYGCVDRGDRVEMEDPDDFCGSAQGTGPLGVFYGWYYSGPKAGQIWSMLDLDPTTTCVPQSQVGNW